MLGTCTASFSTSGSPTAMGEEAESRHLNQPRPKEAARFPERLARVGLAAHQTPLGPAAQVSLLTARGKGVEDASPGRPSRPRRNRPWKAELYGRALGPKGPICAYPSSFRRTEGMLERPSSPF